MMDESVKMKRFDHPNVISLIGVCVDAGIAPYLIMPFMANGSLLSYLKRNREELVLPDTTDEDIVSCMFTLGGENWIYANYTEMYSCFKYLYRGSNQGI